MTNRELDTFIVGFAIGSIVCLWLGYRLRVRVERWQARRHAKRVARNREHDFPTTIGHGRRAIKTIPLSSPNAGAISLPQDVRIVLRKPRRIPLERRPVNPNAEVIDPDKAPVASIPIAPGGYAISPGRIGPNDHAVVDELRAEVIAALVGSGYRRFDAGTAVDACTFAERSGGLESWAAAAFRRAASK